MNGRLVGGGGSMTKGTIAPLFYYENICVTVST